MSGDASNPEQDQTIESAAAPASQDLEADAVEAGSDQAPVVMDPKGLIQKLEQGLNTLKQEHEVLNSQ